MSAGHQAHGNGIGQPVRRTEDARLVTGRGCYSDDVSLPGQLHAIFVRSPHAHAIIRSVETRETLHSPGVVAVLTGVQLREDGVKPLPHHVWALHPADIAMPTVNGSAVFQGDHHAIAWDKARHVGEIVAMVVATSLSAAKDGAERVAVDYETLASVTNTRAAAEQGAPVLWDELRSNVCADVEIGDREATEAAFASAKHIVSLDTWVQRVTGVPMEPRSAVCAFDSLTRRYTIHTGSGGAVRLKNDMAHMLGVDPEQVHVIMRDVGGNFGTKGMIYPEHTLVAWAARKIGRPVKWTCERTEAFATDYQARDLAVTAELALDADGTFLAMRGSNIGNAGAHTTNFSPLQKGVEIMTSIYRIPAAFFRARPVVSNTAPTRPYRSAGRPEVMFVMERLIDIAAYECGFDRVALRRRNLLRSDELPHTNPFGMIYDSGDYPAVMEIVLKLGDWQGFAQRREESRARGKLRGIGVANYVDTATGVPRERAEVIVHPEGKVDVIIGTISSGQGHETSFAQIAAEWLGVAFEKVRIIAGDTDLMTFGGGTHSGRSMRLGSVVIWNASREVIAKARRIAGIVLGQAPDDVVYENGMLRAPDGASLSLFDASRLARERNDLPDDLRAPLSSVSDVTIKEAEFPYGSHVCEVEIDPTLGTITLARYSTVDDAGRAVNPMIIHGQTHGGIAQGAGQALIEQIVYDPNDGQLLSASFMDYAMPRADMFPFFDTEISEIPSSTHPLGFRPAGEGGTTPALAVVINAVVDALAEFGVRHLEMPATPERVWRAIRSGKQAAE